mgnify:CR=1 FL=1
MAEVNTRKRGSNWEYRFEIASVGGKRKQKSKGGFRTKKEALEAGTKALNEYNNTGLTFTASDMSVSDYMDLWFEEYCKLNLKYRTQLNYKGMIENHINPKLGQYKISGLTPAVLQTFINNIKIQGLSRSRAVGLKALLTSSLRYAIHPLGLIQVNPATDIIIPKFEQTSSKRFIITQKDFKRILRRFPFGSKFYIPLLLGYTCGLRLAETYAIDIKKDINFDKKELHIRQTVYKRYGDQAKQSKIYGWFIGTPKSITSDRVISLDDFTIKELKREIKRQKENKLFYGAYYTKLYLKPETDEKMNNIYKIIESDVDLDLEEISLLMVDENGKFVNPDSIKYCSRVVKSELGIEFNYHSLRHTHATMLIENGANPKNVSVRLGHANVSITLNRYTHNTEYMNSDTVNIINSVIAL